MSYGDFKRSAQGVARRANLRDARKRNEKILEKQYKEKSLKRRADREIGNDLYLDIPDVLKLSEKYIDCVGHNKELCGVYSDYYYRMFVDTNLDRYLSLSWRIENCHKYWCGDRYNMQRVFDVQHINLCHDKFCVNCQHLKQASRLKRFTPVLDSLREDYDLYHLVITVKNVPGNELKSMVNKMFDAFKKLQRYFSGDAKIKGMNFAKYGYGGAVRCLEIVTNPEDYHPHIHSLLLLRKGLEWNKCFINKFSFDKGILTRRFSDLEINIQKMVYLIINGKKVCMENLNGVTLGYSCILNEVENDDWHEVFKYAVKLTKDGMPLLTYEQFKTLYAVLYRRKVMQGYGALYRVAEDDGDDEEVALEYAKILAKLRAVEKPEEGCTDFLDKVISNIHENNMTYISKRMVQAWLNDLAEEESV